MSEFPDLGRDHAQIAGMTTLYTATVYVKVNSTITEQESQCHSFNTTHKDSTYYCIYFNETTCTQLPKVLSLVNEYTELFQYFTIHAGDIL